MLCEVQVSRRVVVRTSRHRVAATHGGKRDVHAAAWPYSYLKIDLPLLPNYLHKREAKLIPTTTSLLATEDLLRSLPNLFRMAEVY